MTYELVFWCLLFVFGVSLLYPWHPTWPYAKWLVHLPVLLIPMWLAYEALMPPGMNIRLDLVLILLGLEVAAAIYVGRLILFAYLRSRSRTTHSADHRNGTNLSD